MSSEESLLRYRPGGFYFRRAWREARSDAERTEIFETLLTDHEKLRAWCRAQGLIPPKFDVIGYEAIAKPELFTHVFPGAQLEMKLPEKPSGERLPFPAG